MSNPRVKSRGSSPAPVQVGVENIARVQSNLAAWYHSAKRDLPWRRRRDAYAITVSELMLQQTQVATVVPYFDRWLRQFPSWLALAEASEESVLKAWEGLGYYRRARNLHALAKIVSASGGEMPGSGAALLELPGIGPYTAAAVGSIAFGLPLAVLDGNVMRVLTRLYAIPEHLSLPRTRQKLQALADDLLDPSDPSTHNQAMMELGATICLPGKPRCLLCPLKDGCRGRSHPEDFPVKSRTATIKRDETIAIIMDGDHLYCEQVEAGKPWHGLWRLPDFDADRMAAGETLATLRYGITKYTVRMRGVSATWNGTPNVLRESENSRRYLSAREIEKLPFATPHRKMISKYKSLKIKYL